MGKPTTNVQRINEWVAWHRKGICELSVRWAGKRALIGSLIIVAASFPRMGECDAGITLGRAKDGGWGCLDKAGNVVDSPAVSVDLFSEGLAVVHVGDWQTGKYGFIDQTGKFIVEPQFDLVKPFSEGLAAVGLGDWKTRRWGYVDRKGKMAIDLQFGDADEFSQGLAPALLGDRKTGKYGYIDKTGKFTIEPQFDDAKPFSEGLAAVGFWYNGRWSRRSFHSLELEGSKSFTDSKYGFINRFGTLVIKARFNRADSFSEGLAAVCTGRNIQGPWGYIHRTGKFAIEPQFKVADRFSHGLAQVRTKDGEDCYIDQKGRVVWPPGK